MESGNTLYLVACVKEKGLVPTRAKDLYVSRWFCKARAYVERTGEKWLILSAKHGVVDPEDELAPYDVWLKAMKVAYRRKWSERVLKQLEPRLSGMKSVVFLAGVHYREFLVEPLRKRGFKVSIPMEGLGYVEQTQWLKSQVGLKT